MFAMRGSVWSDDDVVSHGGGNVGTSDSCATRALATRPGSVWADESEVWAGVDDVGLVSCKRVGRVWGSDDSDVFSVPALSLRVACEVDGVECSHPSSNSVICPRAGKKARQSILEDTADSTNRPEEIEEFTEDTADSTHRPEEIEEFTEVEPEIHRAWLLGGDAGEVPTILAGRRWICGIGEAGRPIH